MKEKDTFVFFVLVDWVFLTGMTIHTHVWGGRRRGSLPSEKMSGTHAIFNLLELGEDWGGWQ